MEAARNLFNLRGFHQTSIAELATGAQVSVGQIYRLFKGKEDIINAIVEANSDDRCREIAELSQRLHIGEIDVERTFELLLLSFIDKHDEALSFDILAEGFRNSNVGDSISMMCARFRQLIKDFAQGANPRLSGDVLAGAEEMILACMFGLGHRSLSRPDLDAETAASITARMIIAALRAMD